MDNTFFFPQQVLTAKKNMQSTNNTNMNPAVQSKQTKSAEKTGKLYLQEKYVKQTNKNKRKTKGINFIIECTSRTSFEYFALLDTIGLYGYQARNQKRKKKKDP